jgi:hypothetical protein
MNETQRAYERPQAARRSYSPPKDRGRGPKPNINHWSNYEHQEEETIGEKQNDTFPMLETRNEMGRNPAGRSGSARPDHSLLQPEKGSGYPVGSAYLPSGALPSRTDALRHARSTEHVGPARDPAIIDPIMQPMGAGESAAPYKSNLLYGPSLPVYMRGRHGRMFRPKHSLPPDSQLLGGLPRRKDRKPDIF